MTLLLGMPCFAVLWWLAFLVGRQYERDEHPSLAHRQLMIEASYRAGREAEKREQEQNAPHFRTQDQLAIDRLLESL